MEFRPKMQKIKCPDQQSDVLVNPVLGNAKQERLTAPAGQGRVSCAHRFRLDAVINPDSLSPSRERRILPESTQRSFGDAGDCIDVLEALPQYQTIEDYLGKAEIGGDLIRIEIV
jgi:hypothetical protein